MRIAVMVGLASALCAVLASSAFASSAAPVSIRVLSNRADLISGGDALVALDLPPVASARNVRVTVGGRDVTSAFAVRANGRYEGLVSGLALGRNVLTAT